MGCHEDREGRADGTSVSLTTTTGGVFPAPGGR